jgi:hypothetical protein
MYTVYCLLFALSFSLSTVYYIFSAVLTCMFRDTNCTLHTRNFGHLARNMHTIYRMLSISPPLTHNATHTSLSMLQDAFRLSSSLRSIVRRYKTQPDLKRSMRMGLTLRVCVCVLYMCLCACTHPPPLVSIFLISQILKTGVGPRTVTFKHHNRQSQTP